MLLLKMKLSLFDRKSFRERYLAPALRDGLIAMTLPDKPNSRLQKYALTELGREAKRSQLKSPPKVPPKQLEKSAPQR